MAEVFQDAELDRGHSLDTVQLRLHGDAAMRSTSNGGLT